jgi:hypothetical protein
MPDPFYQRYTSSTALEAKKLPAGPQLFNSLPRTLRDLEEISIEDFKEKLAKPSNSLFDVILHQKNIYGGG